MTAEDFKTVIRNRISHFQSHYHAHEAGRLTLALNAIEELIPPEDWTPTPAEDQPITQGQLEEIIKLQSASEARAWLRINMLQLRVRRHRHAGLIPDNRIPPS